MVHRNEVERPVFAVDMRDKLGHLALELGRVGERGRRHLDEDDVPDPLRVVLQKLLECAQLVRAGVSEHIHAPQQKTDLLHNTLDDIQLVPADNNLLALVQRTQGLELRLHTGPQPVPQSPYQYGLPTARPRIHSRILRHALSVDTHRAVRNRRDVSRDIDSTRRGNLIPAYTDTRRREVP